MVNTSAGFKDRYITTESITHSHGDGGEHSHEGIATYTWMDPALAALQAEAIAKALIARRIADEADVQARLEALQGDLKVLDEAARKVAATLQDQEIITTHPRYQYFAAAYGLTVHAMEWEAGAAPTQDELADLVALGKKTGATSVIWEALPPPEALKATADLGFKSETFPLQAHGGPDGFIETYRAALDRLAALAGQDG